MYSQFMYKIILGGENFNAIIVGSGFSGIDISNKLKEAGINFIILDKVSL